MPKFSSGSTRDYYDGSREKFLNKGFPGFEICLEMMRKNDPQMQEDGFFLLGPHAAEFLDRLLAEFYRLENDSLQYWLIELIGKAKSPAAFPFLVEQLYSADESLRYWAIRGLKELDTKEARTILWQARSFKFDAEEETRRFQAD